MATRDTHRRLAVVLFLATTLPLFYLGRGEHSAYLLTFSSYPGSQAAFGLFGGSYILGDGPLMAENTLYVDQILMFNGWKPGFNFYFTATRPIYSFLASLWAPLLGVMGSQVLLNYLAWAAAAAIAWRFTMRLFADSLAALIAVVLVGGGLGFVVHSHDYSPHLVPFTVYYLGLLMIYESRVWQEQRSLRVHLALGVYLAIACLTYTMEFALVAGYGVVSWRRNRWWHIAAAGTIALSSQLVYTAWLNLLSIAGSGQLAWRSVDGPESGKLQLSLNTWAAQLPHPAGFLNMLANGLAQFSFFEFPLVVVLGLAAWWILPRRRDVWLFFLAFFWLPIVAALAYLNYSTARGYLIYGVSLLIYAPLAALFSRGLRSSRWPTAMIAGAGLVILVGSQLFWSTGFLWGYLVPAKAFFGFGYIDWIPRYIAQFGWTPAFSLTGAEPTPYMFGGRAPLRDAGMFIMNAAGPLTYSIPLAAASRLVILGYAAALVMVSAGTRRVAAIRLAGVALVLGLVPVALAAAAPPPMPPLMSTFYTNKVPLHSSLRYSVAISDAFVTELRRHQSEAVTVEFVTSGIEAPFDVRVSGGRDVTLAESSDGAMLQASRLALPEILAALGDSREIHLDISADGSGANPQGTAVFGWQRQGLSGRRMTNARTGQPWPSPVLPALEMRLLDRQGRPILIGF